MRPITFVTGNQHKADNLSRLLGVPLMHQEIDLDEIQSADIQAVVEHKARQAYARIGSPVIVDDVGLGFAALASLPGPFIKFFVEQPNGLEKLCRMLDGFEDRTATGIACIGYYNGADLKMFSGAIEGIIADHPRGESGYGWDKIFIPHDYAPQTRAQLSQEDYDEVYNRIRPLAELKAYLMKI